MGHLSGARVSTIYINTHNYSENMYALIDNLHSALRCHAKNKLIILGSFIIPATVYIYIYIYANKVLFVLCCHVSKYRNEYIIMNILQSTRGCDSPA
jgi:nitrate reductase cytochrome c-type subunit